jgi:type I restriction enzyme S subunit
MSEWKEVEFSKMLVDESISYGIVQPGAHTEINSIPIIRVNNIKNGYIKIDDVLKVEPSIEDKYKKTRLKGGELLITVVGSVGECAIVPDSLKGWNVARAVSVAKIKSEYDTRFIKYAFKTEDIIFQMYGNTNDTVQPTLNLSSLKTLKFNIPDFPEQTAIASVLSSLDDKIDLLHRQNATLEKMAETLFRQWFVEEGKDEWEMGKINDYAIHFKDSIHPQQNQAALYSHYSIPAFDNGKNPINELGQEIQSNKYKVPKNCILFSKLNPHKEKRLWLLQNEVGKNSICSTEFLIVLPKRKEHLYFLYEWLSLKENYNEIASGVGGTSGSHQRIAPNTIYDFQCPLVAMSLIENFNTQIEPLFQKQLSNQTQIYTLTALRETLLPKLMSGEVRVETS